MISETTWIDLKLIFVLVDVCIGIARSYGVCSPWVKRNSNRFVTLLFVGSVFVESSFRGVHLFIVALGVYTWNRPKDDDPPKRRRRKQKERTEESPPNWSGVPEGA